MRQVQKIENYIYRRFVEVLRLIAVDESTRVHFYRRLQYSHEVSSPQSQTVLHEETACHFTQDECV